MATDANNLGSSEFHYEGNVRNPTIIEAGMFEQLDTALIAAPRVTQSGGQWRDSDVYHTGRDPYMTAVKPAEAKRKTTATVDSHKPKPKRRKPVR